MKKGYLFFSFFVLFLISFTTSAQILRHRSGIFFEARTFQADFSFWKVAYHATDTSQFSGFSEANSRVKRSVLPLYALMQEISLFNRILLRADWSMKFNKDNHFSLGLGLGYQQPIGLQSRFPVFIRIMALYEYWNYGVLVDKYKQGDKNLQFGKKEIKSNDVFIFLGNRQHIIRPQLGFSIQMGPKMELAVEGYYCIVVADEMRVGVRGKSLFSKRSSLVATDSRLDVRNSDLQPTTNWNAGQRWGIRLGIIYKSGSN